MSDEDALLAACRAYWEDRTPKLVYADWLDEAGQRRKAALWRVLAEPGNDDRRFQFADVCETEGDAALAAFVRVQVELARTPTQSESRRGEFPPSRVLRELKSLRDERVKVLPSCVAHDWCISIRRGFLRELILRWVDCRDELDTIREHAPIESVTLTTQPELVALRERLKRMRGGKELEEVISGRLKNRAASMKGIRERFSWYLTRLCEACWPGVQFEIPAFMPDEEDS